MKRLLCISNILIWLSIAKADICSHLHGYTIHGTSCFRFENAAKTWEDAEASCVADGGHLASIHSSEEQAFLATLIPSSFGGVWNGLIGTRPSMAWSDGTVVDYETWNQPTPEREGKHSCIKMKQHSLLWRDVWCDNLVNYMCRVDLVIDPKQAFFTKIPGGVPVDAAVVPSATHDVQSVDECALRCQQDAQCAHFILSEDGGKYLCETYSEMKRRFTNAAISGNYHRVV